MPATLALWLSYLGAIAILLMCVLIVLDVLSKFILGEPITGTLELVSNHFMIAAVFLPMAYAQSERSHVDVEIFTLWLKPRATLGLDAVVVLVSSAALAVFSWQAGKIAYQKYSVGESISLAFSSVPIWPARWILPISAAVFAVVLLWQFFESLRGAIRPEPVRPEK